MARLLGLSYFSDTHVRPRNFMSDINYIRAIVFCRARYVADVGIGYSRRHDRVRVSTSTRGRGPRWYGAMSLLTCPCLCATPTWVARIQDKGPSAGILRPAQPVCPITAMSECVSVTACRTPTLCELWLSVAPDTSPMSVSATLADAIACGRAHYPRDKVPHSRIPCLS